MRTLQSRALALTRNCVLEALSGVEHAVSAATTQRALPPSPETAEASPLYVLFPALCTQSTIPALVAIIERRAGRSKE
jgi:hypothetical protein